jgi:glycosyltransferase involved in cell wall biosynthesis
MITLACIIPTLGEREDMLLDAMWSAATQTVPFKEVIVEKEPGRENQDNQAIKINEGIKKSTADAYVFMGDDDQLKPEFVEKMSQAMEESGADIVSCFHENFGDESGIHGPNRYPLCGTIVKKSLWERVGGFPLSAGPAVDSLFYFKCFDAGARWIKIGDALYRSRVHSKQFSHEADWELSRRRKKELFGDKYDRY